tara:strand:- start:451 stop:2343 length:1893 start_codon:yes stop_codon:yes gene_type:complete
MWDKRKNEFVECSAKNILNYKAKDDGLRNNLSKIEIVGEIKFSNTGYDGDDYEYTLERKYTAKLNSKKDNYTIDTRSDIYLTKYNITSPNGENLAPTVHEEIELEIKSIFLDESIANYYFYRGENSKELVKIHDNSQFKNALRELSKIEVFERAKRTLEIINEEYKEQVRINAKTSVKGQLTTISTTIALIKKDIKEKEKILNDKNDNFNKWENKISEAREFLKNNEETQKIQREIDHIKSKIDKEDSLKNQFSEELRSQILNESMFHLDKKLNEKIVTKYNEEKNKGMWPKNITAPFVQELLDHKQCICGDKINKEKEENIKRLLNSTETDTDLNDKVLTLFNFNTSILNNRNELIKKIKELDVNIALKKEDIRKLDIRKKELEKKIPSDASPEIQSMLKQLEDGSRINGQLKVDIKNLDKELYGNDSLHSKLTQHEKEYQKLLKSQSKKDLPNFLLNISTELLDATIDIKDIFDRDIFNQLESGMNIWWKKLCYDTLNYKSIKLNKEKYSFDVLGPRNNVRTHILNTGHGILMAIDFIGCLMNIAEKNTGQIFPLIMDAPISEVGESGIKHAISGISDLFSHSILILQDGTYEEGMIEDTKVKDFRMYNLSYNSKEETTSIKEIASGR